MIKVYHVSDDDHGEYFHMSPRIPNEDVRASDEDGVVPRICVCTTIPGCLMALPDRVYKYVGKLLYVYEIEVKSLDVLQQPTYEQVLDAWYTGELWLTVPVTAKKIATYIVNHQADFVGSWYARITLTKFNPVTCMTTVTPIGSMLNADLIYGDPDHFSMIEPKWGEPLDTTKEKSNIIFK